MIKTKRILYSYLIGWFIANLVWFALRNVAQPSYQGQLLNGAATFIITWLLQALGYGWINVVVNRYLNKRVSFSKLMVLSLLLQLSVAFVMSILAFFMFVELQVQNVPVTLAKVISMPVITLPLLYALITNFTITLFNQISRMLGKGMLVELASGKYYQPRKDGRILMFLDLRGSTTIAEKLGPHTYSELLQDCFYDLAIVDEYGSNVYKYVGDEAILEWKSNNGIAHMNCIKAYFAFRDRLEEKSEYYLSNYGLIPEFKAGMHIGNVIISEIGELKREIALNGDTVNTTARIEGECNRLKADLLISDELLNHLALEAWVKPVLKGEIQLKGKEKYTKLYAIEIKRMIGQRHLMRTRRLSIKL